MLKEPASKSIATSDRFRFNGKFTDRMRRIKVWEGRREGARARARGCVYVYAKERE